MVYGHLIGVMIPVLFAAAAVGYVLLTGNEDQRSLWRFVKAAVLGAVVGFLISTGVGSLSYMEATESPRNPTETTAECLAELTPAFVASTSLRHRSDALSQIRSTIRRDCRGSQQTVEMQAAAYELGRGNACDNLASLYTGYLWFSRLEELSEECSHRFSPAVALQVNLALGDFEGASIFAEEYETDAEELEADDLLRHARIHVAAGRYSQAQSSLEKAIEEITAEAELEQSHCALAALKAKQGDARQLTAGDNDASATISCGRYFADLAGLDDVENLANAAYEGRSMPPLIQFLHLFLGRTTDRLHDAFFKELLQILEARETLTDDERWRRAILLIARAVFELRLDHLDEARSSLDSARSDIDYFLEHDALEASPSPTDLHTQSFRIEEINSVVALRKRDFEGARNYLDRAMELQDPSFLQYGTAQYSDFLAMMESGEIEEIDDIAMWMIVDYRDDVHMRLFQAIRDDDASEVIDILDSREFSGIRSGLAALIMPYLSEESVAEVGRFIRWSVRSQDTHIYRRDMDYALEELQSVFRLAKVIGDQQWVDELQPVLDRYHEVYFDLDRYRILTLLELHSSHLLPYKWTTR